MSLVWPWNKKNRKETQSYKVGKGEIVKIYLEVSETLSYDLISFCGGKRIVL